MRIAGALLACALFGCGGDSETGDAATSDLSMQLADLSAAVDLLSLPDLAVPIDLTQPGGDAGGGGSSDGMLPMPMVTLKLENYLNWCSVSVNGGLPNTMGLQTLTFPPNTVVTLNGATANASLFVWGYWVGTAGDTSPSHDHSMATTVTMDTNKTVQACCPLTSSPTTPCPPPT
jgi:hypothetical protein